MIKQCECGCSNHVRKQVQRGHINRPTIANGDHLILTYEEYNGTHHQYLFDTVEVKHLDHPHQLVPRQLRHATAHPTRELNPKPNKNRNQNPNAE